jgi:uroporphyrin-III C-methyltransferase
MARDQLVEVSSTLLAQGYSTDTPVCLMESVSLPSGRSFACTLDELRFGDIHHHFVGRQPVVVMVGEVYRKQLQLLHPLIQPQFDFEVLQAAS